jgi:hypothetical protein
MNSRYVLSAGTEAVFLSPSRVPPELDYPALLKGAAGSEGRG